MFEIDKQRFGNLWRSCGKRKVLLRKSLQKNYLYQIKQLASGKREFPKQKDIKE